MHRTLPGAWQKAGALCGESFVGFGYGNNDRFAVVTEGAVRVWDIRSGRALATVDERGVQYATISRDGSFLATAGSDEVRVWRLTAPSAPVFRHSLNNQHLYDCLAWDHERRPAVHGRRDRPHPRPDRSHDVPVAQLPSGPGRPQDLVQGDQVSALAFSPDGGVLAAGDQTGRAALWDGDVRHRARVLRNVFPAPLGDTPEAVGALALSPDGRTLAVGGDAGTLQLWDTETQQPLGGPLPTPGEALKALAFSADSGTLYAGSAHVPLQRYAVDTERAVTKVCTRAGGGLTRAQWRTYVPDVPFRKVCGSG
ncbi:WD40 repeat domain-containing protein [Streptomyces sp. NBC_00443]|uniref:WD40 repeat domain-containing protein n=1 Tax=Streptomyces sp. NBC_00443 TaxID=2975743 RepID=UPI002E23BF87